MSQSSRSGVSTSGVLAARPYVSKVGILPSSLPSYHKDFMARRNAGEHEGSSPSAGGGVDEPPSAATEADRQEIARRLKPHSRSQLRLDEATKRPQGMTPINPPRKSKGVRWQFGIRSRNAPWEALLTIHKALKKLGATYIPDEDFDPGQGSSEPPSGEGSFSDDYQGRKSDQNSTSKMDPLKRYKLPADPWNIKVRWESSSKFPFSHVATIHFCPTLLTGL
jgi:carbon catabolite-derepressing protein kinase